MDRTLLSPDAVGDALSRLHPDWAGTTQALTRSVTFGSFPQAVDFIVRLVPIAEEMDHHPDLALSYRTVGITLSTHAAGGVTVFDTTLASRLDAIIAQLQAG